jgi:hypothetical protein
MARVNADLSFGLFADDTKYFAKRGDPLKLFKNNLRKG